MNNFGLPYKLSPGAVAPTRAYDSPGVDMYANEDVVISPGGLATVSLGVAFEIPFGYVGIIRDRSSTPRRGFFSVAGVIDPDYRGEIKAQVINHSRSELTILRGEKIVQMLILPAPIPVLQEVTELSDSVRGDRGFGSSGAAA